MPGDGPIMTSKIVTLCLIMIVASQPVTGVISPLAAVLVTGPWCRPRGLTGLADFITPVSTPLLLIQSFLPNLIPAFFVRATGRLGGRGGGEGRVGSSPYYCEVTIFPEMQIANADAGQLVQWRLEVVPTSTTLARPLTVTGPRCVICWRAWSPGQAIGGWVMTLGAW